ncbi:repetitive organellar protein-like isoform X1 [Chironomus tepperi]|uniref:repetitive organellar protein-like isoform X1 n=1 Tax=Chironomus tepperi TaxID=113505 RepID=UPI00391FBE41
MDRDMLSIDSKTHEVEGNNDFINNNKEYKDEELIIESNIENKNAFLNEIESNETIIIGEKVLLNQDSSKKISSQTKLEKYLSKDYLHEKKSKTCINCGKKYGNYKKCARNIESKRSSGENIKPQKLSEPSSSRSKCSQFSKYSDRSLAPCKSFENCSKCNQVIFATNPSCASFDFCKRCKKSSETFPHTSCNSQSRVLKVRSVTFSACDDNHTDNISQMSNFCGCNSTMNCNKRCENESQDCADHKISISNKNLCPPKEPSQLSMMKNMLQKRIDACNNVQQKTDVKKSINNIMTFSRARRHHIKKINKDHNDLECPSNPCCISDERKERLNIVTNKLVQREDIRQKKIQQKREEKLKMLQMNQCENMDDCKMDGKCTDAESNNSKCKTYCKKYNKMKYEIELQNYLIDKLNREIQTKISKNYPQTILMELNNHLEKEIMKLKEMIEFTIFEQFNNKDLGWGAIPISSLTSNKISISQPSCGLPKSPCVSNVSTFSMLKDLNLSKEKEKCKIQIEFQQNRQKRMAKVLNEIQGLECKLSELKSVQAQLLRRIGSQKTKDKKKLKKTKFVAETKSQMKQIKNVIDKTKEDIDKIHVGIHLIQNEI